MHAVPLIRFPRLNRSIHHNYLTPSRVRVKIAAMVFLTKIIDGQPPADSLSNIQLLRCPRREQKYCFASSDEEWHKVHGWLRFAEAAIRDAHPAYAADSLALVWKVRRSGR